MQPRKLVALALLLVFCWGCRDDLNLTIHFDRISGLKQGDAVVWDRNRIGTVDEVRYTAEARYEVEVTVDERFRHAVTDRSRFLVQTAAPESARVLEMILTEGDGTPVSDGAVLEGTTRARLLTETVQGQIDGFLEELRRIPESEAIRGLERQLDELAEEMGRAGSALREKIQKEILPQLERELDGLREWLRKKGREEEADPLQEKLEELKRA